MIDYINLNQQQEHYVNEAFTQIIYENVIQRGDEVLDLGAKIGHHTRHMSRLVGEKGIVHAFEPNIQHYSQLCTIALNVRLWPLAAFDKICIEKLHVPLLMTGWASLVSDVQNLLPNQEFSHIEIVCVPIDALSEINPERVSFCKIDVERTELQALRGMKQLLIRSRPVIVIENVTPQIREFFATIDFKVCDFLGNSGADALLLPNQVAIPSQLYKMRHDILPNSIHISQVEKDLRNIS